MNSDLYADQNLDASYVEFFFDPLCPWAYQASLWIREVRRLVAIRIEWRFFSLEETNLERGEKHPWERDWSYGWGPMRVGAYLRRQSMEDLDNWYAAIGRALHENGEKMHNRSVAERIAEEAGFGREVVEAAISDPSTNDEVREDHEYAVRELGAFGVPTLDLGKGRVIFGPVVAPAPKGEEAVRLFRLILEWAEFPYLYELQRPKTSRDLERIASVFQPYLRAK